MNLEQPAETSIVSQFEKIAGSNESPKNRITSYLSDEVINRLVETRETPTYEQ